MTFDQIKTFLLKVLQDYLTNATAIGAVVTAIVLILSGDASGATKLFAALVALFTTGAASKNYSQSRKLAVLERRNAALEASHADFAAKATHDIGLLGAAVKRR